MIRAFILAWAHAARGQGLGFSVLGVRLRVRSWACTAEGKRRRGVPVQPSGSLSWHLYLQLPPCLPLERPVRTFATCLEVSGWVCDLWFLVCGLWFVV